MAQDELPTPRLIIFDLDNTFYSYDACNAAGMKAAVGYICENYGLDAGAVKDAFKAARKTVKAKTGDAAASHNRLIYFQHTYEQLGLGARLKDSLAAERLFWQVFLANMELASDVANVFQTIKAARISTAMITDLTTEIQIRKLMRLGLAESFDYFVTSEECSGEKLSGAPYEALMAKAEIEAGPHLWMIGDAPADMAAADYVGATTINIAEFTRTDLPGASIRVNSFAQLDDALRISL